MHRTDARAGEHGDGGVDHHRHVDSDAVALLDAIGLEHVGEAADLLVQLAVGHLAVGAWGVAFPEDRDLVAARGEMPIDAVGGDVQNPVLVPFDRDVGVGKAGVLDLGRRLDPVEPLGLFGPEPVRIADRARVHLVVLRLGGQRARSGRLARRKHQIVAHRLLPELVAKPCSHWLCERQGDHLALPVNRPNGQCYALPSQRGILSPELPP